jgi:hypothetical protein
MDMDQSQNIYSAVIPLVFCVSLLALLVGYIYTQKKRVVNLRTTAEAMGFSFSTKGDASLLKNLQHFHLFSQGHSRKIRNLVQGKVDDVDVAVFDFIYNPMTRKGVSKQTVILLESDRLQLPPFALRPERLMHKVGSLLGYHDIDFDDYPTFSKRYILQGRDEEQVRSLFNSEVLWHYEELQGVSTEGAGRQLIYYRASRRTASEALQEFLEEGLRVYHLFRR